MIACPECTRDVSSRARSCPGCGYPLADIEKAPSKRWAKWALAVSTIVLLVLVGNLWAESNAARYEDENRELCRNELWAQTAMCDEELRPWLK